MKIFYHKNCPDGLVAAHIFWLHRMYVSAAREREGDEYIAVDYGTESVRLINNTGGERVFVDYCPHEVREGDRIYDHHPLCGELANRHRDAGATVFYDPDECGASIVSRVLNMSHWYVPFARDRDLWLGLYPLTKTYTKGLQLQLDRHPEDVDLDPDTLLRTGDIILDYEDKYFEGVRYKEIDIPLFGTDYPVVLVNNTLYTAGSDLAEYLRDRTGKTVIMWAHNGPRTNYSIRGPRAREIAQSLGGDGHAEAAGANSEVRLWDV